MRRDLVSRAPSGNRGGDTPREAWHALRQVFFIRPIGKRLKAHNWTAGWTTVKLFPGPDATRLFLLKQHTGDVQTREMNEDGTVGALIARARWTTGWTTAEFYEMGGRTFLFLHKARQRSILIHEMNADGRVGRQVSSLRSATSWTFARFYRTTEGLFLFLFNSFTRDAHIQKMKSDGTIGAEVLRRKFSKRWTAAEFFEIGGTIFILTLEKRTGLVEVHRVNPDGKFGALVTRRNWSPGWTRATVYGAAGSLYLFLLKEFGGDGQLYRIKSDGNIGDQIDRPQPFTVSQVRQLLTEAGRGKTFAADYWHDMSEGKIDLRGSVVRGWFTIREPWETVKRPGSKKGELRARAIQASVDAAAQDPRHPYTVPQGHRVIAIHNTPPESGTSGARRILGHPFRHNLFFYAHEMGHTLGFYHSFSDDTNFQSNWWADFGQYDNEWDIMGKDKYAFPFFGADKAGPGMNGYNLRVKGWLPDSEVTLLVSGLLFFNTISGTFPLTSLSVRDGIGKKLLTILRVNKDRLYTVELRTPDNWDRGIPQPVVLIHELKRPEPGKPLHSYLLRVDRSVDPKRPPVQKLSADGLTITVGAINAQNRTVDVSVAIT